MADVELIMPKMGESIMEAKILSWLKKPGDKIEQDEYILEVETDKVDTEIPSAHAGVLKKILAKEGEVVKVGSPIAIITADSAVSQAPVVAPTASAPKAAVTIPSQVHTTNGANRPPVNDYKSSNRFYSPLVKNIAKEENIAVAELEAIASSGAEGRVTKKDILEYVQHRKLGQTVSAVYMHASGGAPLVPAIASGEDEIIVMDRMRKMIAERMIDSKRTSAHVTSFVEADVSNIVFWRNKVKADFERKEGEALTFTPIFIEAVIKAIKDFPMINVQVDGDRIIKKREINIGMAVALPTGNLIVPVIRKADQYSLNGLAKIVNDLARRARENKLKPDDLAGGTFTVSNVGSFGNVMGTPIIMQPQVAILGVGTVEKRPVVVDDAIGIRPMA